MYATAHWDLVTATLHERLTAARRTTVAPEAPVTPGQVRVWGPRASRSVRLAPVIQLPEPRTAGVRGDAVLLDA